MATKRAPILKRRVASTQKEANKIIAALQEAIDDPSKITWKTVTATEAAQLFGHPRFYELSSAENDLHSRKNRDYAGGGVPMGNFERVAKFLEMYPGFPLATPFGVGIVYMLKQLDAAMWLLATKREGQVEGVAERLGDIGVYAKLVRIMYEESRNAK